MKITIDTKEDSKDEIVKMIRMLSELVDHNVEKHSNIFEDTPVASESDSPTLMGMFDNPVSVDDEEDDNKEEEKDDADSIQIVPY